MSEPNRWIVLGVNARTGKREVIAVSAMRETAICHKIDLESEQPRRFCGVTVEYGRESEYRQ